MATEEYSVGYDSGYQDGWNAAIEQAQKQEPVAITITGKLGNIYSFTSDYNLKKGDKIYTSPPQRQPLTRGQIREIEVDVSLNQSFDYITPAEQLCRAIEAAHGIKE